MSKARAICRPIPVRLTRIETCPPVAVRQAPPQHYAPSPVCKPVPQHAEPQQQCQTAECETRPMNWAVVIPVVLIGMAFMYLVGVAFDPCHRAAAGLGCACALPVALLIAIPLGEWATRYLP